MSSSNHVLRRPAAQLMLASLGAALSMGVSQQALAACAGTAAAPNTDAATVICNDQPAGTNGNLTVTPADLDKYKDTSTTTNTGSNITIQFDGHGRLLTNTGTISNERIINGTTNSGKNHTAVIMGAGVNATSNANNTGFSTTTPPAVGNTVLSLGSNAAVANAWVGQTIVVGRYDSADSDFFPGTTYTITAVDTVNKTVTISAPLGANFAGTADPSLPLRFAVVANYGAKVTVDGVEYNDALVNSGTISAKLQKTEIDNNKNGGGTASPSYTATTKGVTTNAAGTYLIDNKAGGVISATSDGIGTTTALEAGGLVAEMTIKNAGTIVAERTTPIDVSTLTVSATANPTAKLTGYSAFTLQTMGLVQGIYSEEEAESIKITNYATGIIRGKGDFTGALYLRAEEQKITNYGLIEHVSSAGGTDYSKGYAIGSVSNGNGVRELEFDNYGTVHGDILSVNGNALRWYLLSTQSGSWNVNDRLTINSHVGQANSEIENHASGTIVGNFWYSNGEHELENAGTIVGNINVDQRDTTNGTETGTVVTVLAGDDDNIDPVTGKPKASNNTNTGGGIRIRGDKTFEFENEGKYKGDVTITNAASNITNGTYGTQTGINKTVASNNTITNSGLFEGNITITDVAGAKNTVNLVDDGFGRKISDGTVNSATGNISATTGAGNNILNLEGIGTLRGNVSQFTTLNLAASDDAGYGGDDDDDDDAPAAAGSPNWTFAFGKTFEFLSAANIDAGTLNVLGTLKTPITNIGEDGTLKGTGTIEGNVLNKGTIDVEDKTLHVVGNVTLDDDSKLATTITNSGNGILGITGHLNADDDAVVVANLERMVWSGESFTVATTTTGITGLPEVAETALMHWDASVVSNNLIITADVANANEIEGMSKPGASAINALLGFDNELGVALLGVEDEGDVKKAGNQLAPETNFATQQAAIALNNAVGQHIDMRLNAVGATGAVPAASGPYGLGMKQPSDPNRSNLGGGLKDDADFVAPRSAALWGQAFGAGLNQNGREQVDGYDARIYGALAGYDNWISPGVRIGVAGGYANTRINGDGDTSQNHTEIDSYLFQAYGAVKGSGWYASARTGFTWNDYDTTRVLTIPFSDKAEGSHDGGQFNAAVEIGAPMRFASTILTPVASLTYSRLHQSGYTESSDGDMALDVRSQDNDSLVSGLGLKALVPIANDTVIQGRALWLHEFGDDAQNVAASFAAGGGTFAAGGPAVGRDTAALGVGMLAQISAESTFELNYDANVREDYLAHIGSARIDVHF